MILAHHLPGADTPSAPGPPILFVHGAWHGAWCWENFVPWFTARGHEIYTVDLRGHGHHHHPGEGRGRGPGIARIRDYVEDLDTAIRRIGTPPALVGHSMGAIVIQKYLEDHMAPVAVLLASAPPGGALRATVRGFVRHVGAMPRILRHFSLAPLLDSPQTMRDLMFCAETPESVVEAASRRLGEESLPAFLDMHGLDLPDAERILTPVVVVGAEEDGIFSRDDVESTAAAYGTEAIFLPGGHDLMLDVAWEEAAEVVRRAVVGSSRRRARRRSAPEGGVRAGLRTRAGAEQEATGRPDGAETGSSADDGVVAASISSS